jgi:hypothetical protein
MWSDNRLDDLSKRVDEGFARIDADLRAVNSRMDAGFKRADDRMDAGFKQAHDRMDAGFKRADDRMEAGFDRLNDRFDVMARTMVQFGIAVIVALIGILATQL